MPSETEVKGKLGRVLKPVRSHLAVACTFMALASAAGVVPFIAVVELAETLLAEGPLDTGRLWAIVWVAVGALFVRFVCMAIALLISHMADVDLQLSLRRTIAAHLGTVPLGWFSDTSSGEVKKAMQDDITDLHHLVGHATLDLTASIVTPLIALAYLFTVDWRMALITLLPVPLFVFAYSLLMRDFGERMAVYNAALGRLNSAVVEFMQGIAVVKAFGQARRAHQRFIGEADEFADYFGRWVRESMGAGVVGEMLIAPAAILLIVMVGGTAAIGWGWIEPFEILAFALLGLAITQPVLALGFGYNDLERAQQAAGRLHVLLGTPPLPVKPDGGAPPSSVVSYREVSFSYDGEHPAVIDVDLDLEVGTSTALVGPSGSGKSTLAALLPRFHDVDGGSISVGGTDVRDLDPGELYRTVGFVFQDPALLRASVADNIALAVPDADREQIEDAARAAQIHDRITELPDGYDAVIGETAHLSGGESQRIAIARALLADTPVLVLDEATAFADPESEAAIQDALSTWVAGRTLLVVAHRLSTVTEVDQILVLDQGRVVERGAHDELVAGGGRYAAMWAAHERASGPATTDDADAEVPA